MALSGDTAITGSSGDGDTVPASGSVYVFVRRDSGTWEEVKKLTPADGEDYDYFGWSVAISGDNAAIGALWYNARGEVSGSGYVYTKIDREWIENVNIVPEDGAASDYYGTSVAIPGSTALFGAPDAGEENGGSTYVVDLCVP